MMIPEFSAVSLARYLIAELVKFANCFSQTLQQDEETVH
jgi:hypothetical protein